MAPFGRQRSASLCRGYRRARRRTSRHRRAGRGSASGAGHRSSAWLPWQCRQRSDRRRAFSTADRGGSTGVTMELALSPTELAFKQEVHAFINENLPRDIAERVAHDLNLKRDDYMRWQQILGRKGWHAYTWPQQHGGPGWSAVQRFIFETT